MKGFGTDLEQKDLTEMAAPTLNAVQGHLQKIVDDLKPEYEASLRKMIDRSVERWEPQILGSSYSKAFGNAYAGIRRDPFFFLLRNLYRGADANGNGYFDSPAAPRKRIPQADWKAKIDNEVKHLSDMMYTGFLAKNMEKLNLLLGADKVVQELKGHINRASLTGYLTFKFTDGSGFEVSFTIVDKVNQKGTFFQQFPTKFHNVVFSDGTKMKTPSEAKMKKEFH